MKLSFSKPSDVSSGRRSSVDVVDSVRDFPIFSYKPTAQRKNKSNVERRPLIAVLKLEEWMYYFRTEGDEKVKILLKNDPLFRKAHKDYLKFTEDDQLSALSISREKDRRDHLTRLADAREEGLLEGVEKGLLEGLEKGRDEMSLAIAKEMKAGGEDPSKIVQYTGLSLEEIENL